MENCRIAGPIFIVLGLIFVTVGRTKYYSERANAPQPPATVMMSTPATATVGYQTNPAPIHYQPQAHGYQQGGYVYHGGGYPPAQNYPPQSTAEGDPNGPPAYDAGDSAPPPD